MRYDAEAVQLAIRASMILARMRADHPNRALTLSALAEVLPHCGRAPAELLPLLTTASEYCDATTFDQNRVHVRLGQEVSTYLQLTFARRYDAWIAGVVVA